MNLSMIIKAVDETYAEWQKDGRLMQNDLIFISVLFDSDAEWRIFLSNDFL